MVSQSPPDPPTPRPRPPTPSAEMPDLDVLMQDARRQAAQSAARRKKKSAWQELREAVPDATTYRPARGAPAPLDYTRQAHWPPAFWVRAFFLAAQDQDPPVALGFDDRGAAKKRLSISQAEIYADTRAAHYKRQRLGAAIAECCYDLGRRLSPLGPARDEWYARGWAFLCERVLERWSAARLELELNRRLEGKFDDEFPYWLLLRSDLMIRRCSPTPAADDAQTLD